MNDVGHMQSGGAGFAPLTIGQIVDRVFQLVRGYFRLLVGIALVPSASSLLMIAVIATGIGIPVFLHFPNVPDFRLLLAAGIPLFLLLTLLNLVVLGIYLAAACHAAMQANLGVRVTIGEAYRVALQQWGRYGVLVLLCYVYSFLPALLVELCGLAAFALTALSGKPPSIAMIALVPVGWLLQMGALIYGVFMALRLSLAFPACVAEGLTATAAIKRSGVLTRGARGRIFLVLLIVYAATYLLFLVVYFVVLTLIVFGGITVVSMHVDHVTPGMAVGLGALGLCLLAFLVAWTALAWAGYSGAFAVLYHERRRCLEGLESLLQGGGDTA